MNEFVVAGDFNNIYICISMCKWNEIPPKELNIVIKTLTSNRPSDIGVGQPIYAGV